MITSRNPGGDAPRALVPRVQELERLLADLSARFIGLHGSEVDAAITDALRRIVLLLDVDRSQLIWFPTATGEAEVTHSWAVEGVSAVRPKAITGRFPWVIGRLRGGHPVVIPRVVDLPSEAAVDMASYRRAGVRSSLLMPLMVAAKIEGALALGCLRREQAWLPEVVECIRVVATILGNALAHKRAQEALGTALEFERSVSRVLAALLAAGPGERDSVIEAGLRDLAQVFGTERATLWQRIGDRAEFAKTHRWLAEHIAPPANSLGTLALPWISAQLVKGAVVRFARYVDLPPEAAEDLVTLRKLDVRAAVMVPLATSGSVVGALSFATVREDREWPDDLIPRARLVGEVFTSLIARTEAERREHEAEIHAAHAARVGTMGVFAASLVHEITQPIAAGLANAETVVDLLSQTSLDVDELRATAADMVADNRRARELIQQLRHFLRRGEVERVALNFREIQEDVVRLVANAAEDKGVELVVDCSLELPKFVGDRVQIQQVLLNLLLNAFDAVAASPTGYRRVTVSAEPSEAGLRVEVADTGGGMDAATLKRVFQPFFTTKAGGMGLGLSISQTIVATHGGALSVRSEPGRGTTFRIELPLQSAKGAVCRPPVVAPVHTSGVVFVIDDDQSMRRALERRLQGAGYAVRTFESAQEFLDSAPAPVGHACIVSDVRMPGLSGLDLHASLVRAQRDLPTIFISGHGDIATSVHAMKAGAVSFLSKPFSTGELLAAVADALAQSLETGKARVELADLEARYDLLTRRERDVFALVAVGLLNKLIADRLGIAEATIKIHRGRVMEKMGARSVADLVKMAGRLERRPSPVASPD